VPTRWADSDLKFTGSFVSKIPKATGIRCARRPCV